MTIPRNPQPKRLAALLAMQALLARIAIADGGAFDMSGKVFINRILIGADINANPPAIAIVEAPRPDFAHFAGENNIMRSDAWTLLIQGIVADDRTAATNNDPYYLCQDVENMLLRISATKGSGSPTWPSDYLLGGMITSIEIAPPVIRPPEAQVSSSAFFYLPIRVGIAVKIGE